MSSVSIELPEETLATLRLSPAEFVREMKLAAAMHWYSRGDLSQEKAATLAGMNREQFIDALSRAQVEVCQVTEEELKREWERA